MFLPAKSSTFTLTSMASYNRDVQNTPGSALHSYQHALIYMQSFCRLPIDSLLRSPYEDSEFFHLHQAPIPPAPSTFFFHFYTQSNLNMSPNTLPFIHIKVSLLHHLSVILPLKCRGKCVSCFICNQLQPHMLSTVTPDYCRIV